MHTSWHGWPAALRRCALLVAIAMAATGIRAAVPVDTRDRPDTFATFAQALQQRLDETTNASLEDEWRAFLARHRFSGQRVPFQAYRRVRLLFEATRDGGFWQIRWAITNREPNSREIWTQWERALLSMSAVAECDEISALTAFLARRIGIGPIGLFWPTDNHTIAAWTPVRDGPRILLPTTQIFLGCEEGFDQASYPHARQRTVYDYTSRDLPDDAAIPRALTAELLDRIERYGHASPEVWNLLRYHRHARAPSSTTGCVEVRRTLVARLLQHRTPEDDAALLAYARTELHQSAPGAVEDVLRGLAAP